MRPSLAPRRRLVARLEDGLRAKLILISAAPGAGKTTLLAGWARDLARRGRYVAWLSAEARHNDPARFWGAVVVALEGACPAQLDHARALLRGPSAPDGEALAAALVHALAGSTGDLVLVVDDYHCIANQSIHEGMQLVLEHLPPHVHVVICGRIDPPLPTARMRAAGQLAEIRGDDLRLSLDEVQAFLTDGDVPPLTDGEIEELREQTEGWAAGVWLAALTLVERDRGRGQGGTERRIHRFAADYLIQEVFVRQPPDVQAFLTSTCILDRLCAPLCDAVAGIADGGRILSYLGSAGLFVTPVDDDRRWYRYHPIFAGALRERLAQQPPDVIAGLHRRASAWLASVDVDAAIGHALAAGDHDAALDLVCRSVEGAIAHGELATVVRWVEALPPGSTRERPKLALSYAWALAHTSQIDAAEAALHVARRALGTDGPDAETSAAWGDVLAVEARIAALRRDVERAIASSRRALACGVTGSFQSRADLTLNLAFCLYDGGQDESAVAAFAESWTEARDAGNARAAMLACRYRAIVDVQRANLARAAELCDEALRWAASFGRQPVPASALVHAALGDVLYEWNDLQAAERHAAEGIALGRLSGDRKALIAAYSLFARATWARGDAARADAPLLEGERILGTRPFASLRVAHALALGDVAEAGRWARRHRLATPGQPRDVDGALVRARLAVAEGRLDDARGALDAALAVAQEQHRAGSMIRLLAARATVLRGEGNVLGASEAAGRALELAEPAGFVRTFADEGEPMRAILGQIAAQRQRSDRVGAYAASLLAAMRESAGRQESPPRRSAPAGALVESISEREWSVLRLLAAGKSNQEIARELIVSLNTVKTHLRGVYGKLGVHSRTQALARARAYRLL